MNTSINTLEPPTPAKPRASRTKDVLTGGATLAALVYIVMFALYGVCDHSAFSPYSITSLTNNAAPLILAAAGQTVVVLTRGFDLSLVGTISVANVIVAAYPIAGALGGVVSFALCLVVGALIGLLNGYLVAYRGIQTIAATLGTMIIFQGIALLILPVPGGSVADFVSTTLTGSLAGFPVTGMFVAVFAIAWLILRRTDVGIAFYAVGADETAAGLSAISVRKTRCLAFVIAGVFYGAAGFMLSAQTSTGDPNSGLPFLLLSFAAVALGGTSLGGGQGGLIGSMVGAAVLLLMQKMLFAVGVSSFYTGLFQGLLLIAAILCERALHRIRRNGAIA
ncbi:ABC transporter permease [Caballeronia sp. 15715]|uniref:ABC transporter permease n=1 Tax=Caballeronia sp. 15715 TaxID=3391030 RepID=UPI0039E41686